MNRDLKNHLANLQTRRAYRSAKIAVAVKPMTSQKQAMAWCAEATHTRDAMRGRVVYEADVQERALKFLLVGILFAALGVLGLQDVWVWLRAGASGELALADMAVTAASVGAVATATTFFWRAWAIRHDSKLQELNSARVIDAHDLLHAVGEQHKAPPQGWEKPLLMFGHLLEGAGFAFIALMGLGNLPNHIGLAVAVIMGAVISGAVAYLSRLHSQRDLILQGKQMYRAEARLARELEEAGDPYAAQQKQREEKLRAYLSPANKKQFEALSKLRIGVLWILLGTLIGLAFVLRVIFGSAMGAGAILGAIMLAVATSLIFWANYRMTERFLSVAGDSGTRAMAIAARFPTIEAFTSIVEAHRTEVDLFFGRVMAEASRIYDDVVEARDPMRPRKALTFELLEDGSVTAHAVTTTATTAKGTASLNPAADFSFGLKWSNSDIKPINGYTDKGTSHVDG